MFTQMAVWLDGPNAMVADTSLPPTFIRAYYKSGTFASFDLFGALCCSRAIGGRADRAAACNDRGPECLERKIRFLWSMEPLHAFNRNATIVRFVRHPVDMLVSAYLYALSCNEPIWSNNTGLLLPANTSIQHWHMQQHELRGSLKLAMDAFGGPGERKQIADTLGLRRNESYCAALQRVPSLDGLHAEALRCTTLHGFGIRQMLDEHLYLYPRRISPAAEESSSPVSRASKSFGIYTGQVVSICNSDIDPRRPATADATWRRVGASLNATAAIEAMRPRFNSKFEVHRTKSVDVCGRHALAARAREVLIELAASAQAEAARGPGAKLGATLPPTWHALLLALLRESTDSNADAVGDGTWAGSAEGVGSVASAAATWPCLEAAMTPTPAGEDAVSRSPRPSGECRDSETEFQLHH